MSLLVVPISLREANAFVRLHHRHHGPVRGHKIAVGAEWQGALIAVAILGRAVSRVRQAERKQDVLRLCTDGVKRPLGRNRHGNPTYVNPASFLYARMHCIASAMGCQIGTYILETESGVSVKAAGYVVTHRSAGGSWDTPSRRRADTHPLAPKLLLERAA